MGLDYFGPSGVLGVLGVLWPPLVPKRTEDGLGVQRMLRRGLIDGSLGLVRALVSHDSRLTTRKRTEVGSAKALAGTEYEPPNRWASNTSALVPPVRSAMD